MTATGAHLVAGRERRSGGPAFRAVDPRTGEAGVVEFHNANRDTVEDAAREAAASFTLLMGMGDARRAEALRAIADALEAERAALVATADGETGLGDERLKGELDRTTGQFRFFADLIEEGAHVEPMISTGPPDVRRALVPIGPVAVFGASNFPFAFSVPGGDTASALASGCPVVAKGHPSHPATSELCARAITSALARAGAPAGGFSMVQGVSDSVGLDLVTDPRIEAVAFTGSLRGGQALMAAAADRPRPIPVYAEMGSLNPVFVLSGAARARADEIAALVAASVTLGTGQFCTKPGLVFAPDDHTARLITDAVLEQPTGTLLNESVRRGLDDGIAEATRLTGVRVRRVGDEPGAPVVLLAAVDRFVDEPALRKERFGPVTVVVLCPAPGDMLRAAAVLDGTLTATIHADVSDDADALVEMLVRRVGRLIWNGVPTGVAVVHAMHHGGPWPATGSSLHTSVGAAALKRFLRPVAYQDAPETALPPALRNGNPLGIVRNVDGNWTAKAVGD